MTRTLLLKCSLSACGLISFTSAAVGQVAEVDPAGQTAASAAAGTSDSLSTCDWSSIRAAHDASRHAVFPVDDGYQARNPGQRWRMHFDGRAFLATPDAGDWAWGLELVSYGFAGQERTVTLPAGVSAAGRRVAYDWGGSLTEWYVNDDRGLEHGYTVHERPAEEAVSRAGEPLRFTLAVRGGLCPQVNADGRSVTFVDASGAGVVNYSGLAVFDADGVAVPAQFQPSTMVGSAPSDALVLSVEDRGARYPLTIDPVAQQAYLKASNTDAGDQFGYSVAVSGDTVVVGAPYEDSNATGVGGNQVDNHATDSGAVYVFARSGATWSQQAYLKASNTGADDNFGLAVAVSGDTVVVGAWQEDSNATGVDGDQADDSANYSGAAYVFVRSGVTWSQQAYLKASNTGEGDRFGQSVAVSGDTVVIGAYFEDSNATGVNGNQEDNSTPDSGAAYVFVRSGATWSQQAYLKASNTDADDAFSISVAVSGDTVVVGALYENSNATGVNGNQGDNSADNAGAAYVFVRRGATWSQQAYLKASNADAEDLFGVRVAASGDTVVVGAYFEDSNATGVNGNQVDNHAIDSGAAYVFVRDGAAWSQQAYLKASNTDADDIFGISVAVSGDTVVVAAYFEDSNATGVNGNQEDNSTPDAGAAYVFVRSGATWTQQAYLKASNTGPGDGFGRSVAVSGDTVVVGANYEASAATGVNANQLDTGAPQSGSAYIVELCPADLNADHQVDGADLGILLAFWGPVTVFPAADITGDGIVDGADLGALLAAWGPCP